MTVKVRPARSDDRRAMLAITRSVWNGSDYLPQVWEKWLIDPRGQLLVATVGERAVGLQHVVLQPDGSAWLEGIRVAVDMRGRGVGDALVGRGIAWSREMGSPAARLSTASHNPASNRLAQKRGFRVVGTFQPLRGVPGEGTAHDRVRVAHSADAKAIMDFARRDSVSRGSTRFYTEGWTAHSLTEDRLRLLLGTNSVLVTGDPDISGVAIATATVSRAALRLGFLAGDLDAATALCERVRASALEARLPRVRATVELDSAGLEAVHRTGFEPDEGFRMLLYELALL